MTEPPAMGSPLVDAPSRAAQLLRWALLAAVVLVALAFPVVAVRQASPADLREAVASGTVKEVRVDGGLEPGAVGQATVRVRWQGGGTTSEARLVQASDQDAASSATADDRVVGD